MPSDAVVENAGLFNFFSVQRIHSVYHHFNIFSFNFFFNVFKIIMISDQQQSLGFVN